MLRSSRAKQNTKSVDFSLVRMRTPESAKVNGSERVRLESTKHRAGDGNDHKNKRCELPSTWEKHQPKEGREKQLAKVNEEKEVGGREEGSNSICFISWTACQSTDAQKI